MNRHNYTNLDYHNSSYDLPLFTGEVLRDEGIANVSQHNGKWMELCIKRASHYIYTVPKFTGEDLRHYCEIAVGCPQHSNAWGALINTLLKRKIIEPTGDYRPMRDDSSHARKTPVYRKAK